MKKYEFTGETQSFCSVTLKRIRRISDGLVGGWIESENNLSHYGSSFVYDEAKVYGHSLVYGNAGVYGNTLVCDKASVGDNAKVCDEVIVSDNAKVYDQALAYDQALICGQSQLCGKAMAYGEVVVGGQTKICRTANVSKLGDFLNIIGMIFSVTLQADGTVSIGCQTRDIYEWMMMTYDAKEVGHIVTKQNFQKMRKTLLPIAKTFYNYHGIQIEDC